MEDNDLYSAIEKRKEYKERDIDSFWKNARHLFVSAAFLSQLIVLVYFFHIHYTPAHLEDIVFIGAESFLALGTVLTILLFMMLLPLLLYPKELSIAVYGFTRNKRQRLKIAKSDLIFSLIFSYVGSLLAAIVFINKFTLYILFLALIVMLAAIFIGAIAIARFRSTHYFYLLLSAQIFLTILIIWTNLEQAGLRDFGWASTTGTLIIKKNAFTKEIMHNRELVPCVPEYKTLSHHYMVFHTNILFKGTKQSLLSYDGTTTSGLKCNGRFYASNNVLALFQ